MQDAHKHKTKLRTLKHLLLLSPVLFVWIEIALPVMVAPLFGQRDARAFVYSFIGYGIYLIYTYLLLRFAISAAKDKHATLPKLLLYTAYFVISVIVLAGLHAGAMIFLGLSSQGLN